MWMKDKINTCNTIKKIDGSDTYRIGDDYGLNTGLVFT